MDQPTATRLLDDLHAAQNTFYAGGDGTALRHLLTEDVVWTVPGRNRIAGTYRGLDEVFAYFTRRRDLASRTFRMHRADVLVGSGDKVAALTDGTAVVGGEQRRWSTVGLYGLRELRIEACWLLPLDAALFDEIWGPEPS
ncbi:ketosteroid isomerase-like protein [Haloactinopolyspora alba]|uniref:Ketosteroid isomerase-like protein n=1 Tax=Haloactinopolyspora alba TaxID=648780 RepID=A0A2P8DWI0_9ACTN|nr:nuclear transport factor 2 family protein [Haloactinopolyspora alba]PSL01583.1 ketosteroid isomerase-like protein [Haloactinopolyspora alba]